MPVTVPDDHPLYRVERFSQWMDEAFRIPGTRFRFGLDALIGLIPGVGDAAGLVIGSWLVWEAHRIGTPAAVKWKMVRNVVIDALLGVVPLVGDAVDFAFKSNRRNLALLRAHHPPPQGVPNKAFWGRWRWLAVTLTVAAAAVWFWHRQLSAT